jgi:hypothetical protein
MPLFYPYHLIISRRKPWLQALFKAVILSGSGILSSEHDAELWLFNYVLSASLPVSQDHI